MYLSLKIPKDKFHKITRYAVPESVIGKSVIPGGQVYFTVEVQTASLEFPEAASFVCWSN